MKSYTLLSLRIIELHLLPQMKIITSMTLLFSMFSIYISKPNNSYFKGKQFIINLVRLISILEHVKLAVGNLTITNE